MCENRSTLMWSCSCFDRGAVYQSSEELSAESVLSGQVKHLVASLPGPSRPQDITVQREHPDPGPGNTLHWHRLGKPGTSDAHKFRISVL